MTQSEARTDDVAVPSERAALGEVAALFLRLGCTAFGGPAAHIAMMREEIVRRRGWISDERFLDLLGAVNLIPGPNSTELAIYLGFVRAGMWGLIVAGICFIGPAMLLVLALAWAYVRFGAVPQLGWLLYGIKPVVLAIIAQAVWGLSRTALRGVFPAVFGLGVLVLYLLGVNTLLLLFGGGVLYALLRWLGRRAAPGAPAAHAAGGVAVLAGGSLRKIVPANLLGRLEHVTAGAAATAGAAGAASVAAPVPLTAVFLTFLKIGALAYGSGYVLLAFLRPDVVVNNHWLTDRQLLDAVSIGQVTPGPVFTTATFIGYIIAGVPGALVATLGIFLPAFIFIPFLHSGASALRRSPLTAPLLDGVNLAALALMAAVTLQLGRAALVDAVTVALAVVSLVVLLRYRLNSAWLILGGALVGLGTRLLGG